MIPIKIHPKPGISLAEQLRQQLRHGILSAKIGKGDRLPSVRELALQLKMHPLTVAKAYTALQNEGLVLTQWGKGTFVLAPKGALASKDYIRELASKFIEETLPLVNGKRNELLAILREQMKVKRSRTGEA